MAKRQLPAKREKALKDWHQFTDFEKRAIEAYFRNGFRVVDAFVTAGYSTKVGPDALRANAWRVFRRPHIQAEVERRMQKIQMSKDEALARHAEVGRGDVGDCLVDHEVACPTCGHIIEEAGTLRLDLKLLKQNGLTYLIKKLTPFKDGRIAIELYESDKARTDILKAHGAFRPTPEEEATGFMALIGAAKAAAAMNGSRDEEPAEDEADYEILDD